MIWDLVFIVVCILCVWLAVEPRRPKIEESFIKEGGDYLTRIIWEMLLVDRSNILLIICRRVSPEVTRILEYPSLKEILRDGWEPVSETLFKRPWAKAGPPRPHRASVESKQEIGMAKFGYRFNLGPTKAVDVANREVSVTVNGGEPLVKTFPGSQNITEEYEFNQGDNIAVVTVDIDASGNRSQPSGVYVETVTDTIAPPTPEIPAVGEKRQID